jgi:MFS family permease
MRSLGASRGLDCLFFFVADLQTGFGPFIAVYLTAHSWTQAELGLALGVASASGMLAQVPAGLLVDMLRGKALAAAVALLGIGASALLMAVSPAFWPVLFAQTLHGFASCMLNPALAALTIGLVSTAVVAERFGRNASFAAIGSAVGAGLMGACGSLESPRAVFWLAAVFCLPALLTLLALRKQFEPNPAVMIAPPANETIRDTLLDCRLWAYVLCTALFHLANAAMLPLAAVEVTRRADRGASAIIAACILVPQILVALISPFAGRAADRWGRRSVLLAGFLALPARAALLTYISNPAWIVPLQALDGVSGAAFGVITPLVATDLSTQGGRFNFRMGIFGLAIGSAAAVSNAVAGAIATYIGTRTAFMALALTGFVAVIAVAFVMPETRPPRPAANDGAGPE